MTSDQALNLDYVPNSVIVLGGGVIGVEFASVWKSFGAEVTIVEALPHLVPNEDEACSKALERAFRKRGITLHDRRPLRSRDPGRQRRRGHPRGRLRTRAELLLVAVGRGPNAVGHGLRGGRGRHGARLGARRRAPAHQRPRRLRRRRHRARAAAGPPRLPAGHLRRRGDRRAQPAGHRRARHPAGHLLRARGRLDRPHRGPGAREVRRRRRRVLRVQPRRQRQEPDPGAPPASSSWSGATTARSSASTWSARASASRSARPS